MGKNAYKNKKEEWLHVLIRLSTMAICVYALYRGLKS